MSNPTNVLSLMSRLRDRASDYPQEFSTWELDRLDEWYDDIADGKKLSEKQVAILNRMDVRTA